MTLTGWNVGLAFYHLDLGKETNIILTTEKGGEVGKINVSTQAAEDPEASRTDLHDKSSFIIPKEGWTAIFFPLGKSDIVIKEPGTYFVKLITDEGPVVIAQIQFALLNAIPLMQERIAAIRSDPSAIKAVRIEIGCKTCPSKFRTYAALEHNTKMEEEGYVWYENILDEFKCECGLNTFNLRYYRKNLIALLGYPKSSTAEQNLSYIPLYEHSAIVNLRDSFARLIAANHKEEVLQKFIEDNPIILHQFPAEKILYKPPLLTFFNADFAILTPQKELILIEIEKTSTRLLNKRGGKASSLQHAFDQVQDWLHVVDEHRLAVLDSLKIDREAVSTVRGVVIAGRDQGYDAKQLRVLKGTDFGRVIFLTYDDLLFGLVSLLNNLIKL